MTTITIIIMIIMTQDEDDNGNDFRRTADVRSVGYAELFVLSREDVLAALKDHPDAEVRVIVLARPLPSFVPLKIHNVDVVYVPHTLQTSLAC